MARLDITNDFGEIKLDEKLLPGVYQGMSVAGKVRIKEEEAQGRSGKYKQALGWEDLQVDITLILPNDEQGTPYDKLQELVQVFRKTDKTAKPQVYRIVNKHAAAWGLDQVLIQDLKSEDPPKADYIRVTLSLVEWESPLVKLEARAVQGPTQDRTAVMPSGTVVPELKPWQPSSAEKIYQEIIEVPDDD